jgi:arylsulfatase
MRRPNVVLVLADDLGFSDIGCYGGEIRTPALDRLGRGGVRLSQFYNTARCSPSRASLLTGLHPHQTGIGILTSDDRPRGYRGSLNESCATLAEILGSAGYATCLSGKWHLTSSPERPDGAWPTRRGFEHFFGILNGCGSYYQPRTLSRQEDSAEHEARQPGFFFTDAITAHAEGFVRDHVAAAPDRPFFLYLAYTAPHWPLHAPEADADRYRGVFDAGWDVLRERRLERLVAEGVLPLRSTLSARDPAQPAWTEAVDREWERRRIEVYAAQVDGLDRGVARVVAVLEASGQLDDTLVLFLSDNGGSAEDLPIGPLERFRARIDICPPTTRDGRPVRIGNTPDVVPGPEATYASYGRAWANLSNTPFRLYKRWVHEGGIATPLIVHWPRGDLASGRIVHAPFQLTDIVPTVLEATGVAQPGRLGDRVVLPPEGRSMLAALRGAPVEEATLYWEHIGNAAVRRGRWKLVREADRPWELYDLETDRAESRDLASEEPALVGELAAAWQAWADRVGVVPWGVVKGIYRERGQTEVDAQG